MSLVLRVLVVVFLVWSSSSVLKVCVPVAGCFRCVSGEEFVKWVGGVVVGVFGVEFVQVHVCEVVEGVLEV